MADYPIKRIFLNNIFIIIMLLLGAAVFIVLFRMTWWSFMIAAAYVVYTLLSYLWMAVFICPYCGLHGKKACFSGIGYIAGFLTAKRSKELFRRQFIKHIPVIASAWFIPPVVGGIMAFYNFSWLLIVLITLFVLEAFVLLPIISTRYACRTCPQNDDCPWTKSNLSGKKTV